MNDFSTLIAAGAAGLMLGIVSPLVAYLKVRRKKKKYQFKSEPVSKKITADRRYLNGRRDHSTEEYWKNTRKELKCRKKLHAK